MGAIPPVEHDRLCLASLRLYCVYPCPPPPLSMRQVRAVCERRALVLGNILLKQVLTQTVFDIETLAAQAAAQATAS